MTNRPGIWSHLKDHETFPPQEVFDRIQAVLKRADQSSDQGLKEDMERLGEHEIQPPAFLRKAIEERIGHRRNFLYRYITAAACLLLVVAGFIVYRLNNTRMQPAATMTKKELPGRVVPGTSGIQSGEPISGKKDSAGNLALAAGADTANLTISGKSRLRSVFSIEGQPFPVADNDLLASFASFTWPNLPGYLTRSSDKPLKIHVDQYTSIFISKNMQDMMKEMYGVNSNGKPARKARKAREKLDKWKKSDQRHFDDSNEANPLDPVDLAEFIFK